MRKLFQLRFGGIYLVAILFIAVSTGVRIALAVKASASLDAGPWELIKVFGTGLFYDFVTASYFMIPLLAYLTILPDRIYRSRWYKPFAYLMYFAVIYGLLFDAVAEWLFWDEFGTRFNFIAVDYLIYTREVVGNIRESYPTGALLSAIAVLALLILLAARGAIDATLKTGGTVKNRLARAPLFALVPALSFAFVDGSLANVSANQYANQLAGNGIYDLFAAFRNNELDYRSFYRTEDDGQALTRLRALVREDNASFLDLKPRDVHREIRHAGDMRQLNVMLVTVESLSAEFLGAFGNRQGLTPHLDALAKDSLLFTNLYATGTRTVRGLEAITLSVPPTPGLSIVKRPNNEGLFSIGHVFREKGYDTRYIYGGYGYFDNMNHFFSSNGFEVVDRTSMGADEVHFSNIWGVADEDLFARALREADKSHDAGKPFFNLVMTTSNHRPFTYPEGRIDIPSHTGREGGVKYTDYAIGRLIAEARRKPWFKDTVFVIVADHCASSAGKTDLPVQRYKIPMLVYAPAHIRPGIVNTLASQMDVAPTLLGLLRFDYRSKFIGRDILTMRPEEGRALISTYQNLGYFKQDRLVVLSPQRKVQTYSLDANTGEPTGAATSQEMLGDALAYYQGASYLFRSRLGRWE